MSTRANKRAGADGGMTVLFHAERACPAAAQHERKAAMRASAKEEWLQEVFWSWSVSASTHGKAGARDKFQSLTLTMTHRPTNTIVTRSSAFGPNKSDELAKLRQKMWSELLPELRQEVLNHHEPAA